MLVLFPVALCTGVLGRHDIHVAPGVQADVTPGTDTTAYNIDIALGLQGRIAIRHNLAADTGAALCFSTSFFGRGDGNKTARCGQPDLLLILLSQAIRRVISRHQVDVAGIADQTSTQLHIVAGRGFTGAQANIVAGGDHHVVTRIQFARHLAGRGLELALATLRQSKETGLGFLAVGAMLLDAGQHGDIAGRPHQQIASRLELAADHGHVAAAVDAHAAVCGFAGIEGQVIPRLDHRGNVGAVVFFLLFAAATPERTFLFLEIEGGAFVLGREDIDVLLCIQRDVVAGLDLAGHQGQILVGGNGDVPSCLNGGGLLDDLVRAAGDLFAF